jgi:hypothetical protein
MLPKVSVSVEVGIADDISDAGATRQLGLETGSVICF